MDRQISFGIECGDALRIECDVLVLKHAQALYGVDATVISALEAAGISVRPMLPKPGEFRLMPTAGAVAARAVLFVGVSELRQFDYAAIREFGARAVTSLTDVPLTKKVALTIHGPNYGLDESESFRAELAGLLDSIQSGNYSASLESIVVVERDAGRADRLKRILQSALPAGAVTVPASGAVGQTVPVQTRTFLESVGAGSLQKPHVFVAMPFAKEFDDRFHYGIQRVAESAGFLCERADLTSFTGDVITWVRERIASASFVLGDLTTANPNVYLEVGYAWGLNIPTILLVSDVQDLRFDTRGQRCLVYNGSIQSIEKLLTAELKALTAKIDHAEPKTVSALKSLSLSELQTVVQQQEDLLGPLNKNNPKGLGNDGNQTLLTFDMGQEPPMNKAVLRLTVGGHAVPLDGHELICIGSCFVSNQLIELAAYRPR